jgi:hypothetical protein
MKKIRYVIYLNDNILYLLNIKRKTIYEQQFVNLSQDEIINEQKFFFEFNKFIRTNKIKISLFGYNVAFIKTRYMLEPSLNKYQEILSEYFKKIQIIDILEILNLSKNKTILNITDNHIDFFYKEKQLRINKEVFNNDNIKIIKHFINNIYHSKELLFYGNLPSLPNLVKDVNKQLNIHSIYKEDYKTYILDEFIKKYT